MIENYFEHIHESSDPFLVTKNFEFSLLQFIINEENLFKDEI